MLKSIAGVLESDGMQALRRNVDRERARNKALIAELDPFANHREEFQSQNRAAADRLSL
jgi:hypothetical protein